MFSPQFKADAVQMVISTGKPVAEVARDLGIDNETFGEVGERLAAPVFRAGTAVANVAYYQDEALWGILTLGHVR
jgi:Transposase